MVDAKIPATALSHRRLPHSHTADVDIGPG